MVTFVVESHANIRELVLEEAVDDQPASATRATCSARPRSTAHHRLVQRAVVAGEHVPRVQLDRAGIGRAARRPNTMRPAPVNDADDDPGPACLVMPRPGSQTSMSQWPRSSCQSHATLEYNGRWLKTVEALTPEQRSSLIVDLGFLPKPVSMLTALGMRLSEVANHSWDVRVAFDPHAGVDADSAAVLVDLLAGPVGFLAKPAELADLVSVAIPGAGLVIDDAVTVVDHLESPSATFNGTPEAFVRLLSGRLKAPYDDSVAVDDRITLDDLRRVFPRLLTESVDPATCRLRRRVR